MATGLLRMCDNASRRYESHCFVTTASRDRCCLPVFCAYAEGYSNHQLFDYFLCHSCDQGAGGSGLKTVCVRDPSDSQFGLRAYARHAARSCGCKERHQSDSLAMKSKTNQSNIFLQLVAYRERRRLLATQDEWPRLYSVGENNFQRVRVADGRIRKNGHNFRLLCG